MTSVARPILPAALALILWIGTGHPADVLPSELESPKYTKAYVSMGLGVALTVTSFLLAEEADRAYDDYLQGTDPEAIESDYDRSVTLDRVATVSLITGQAALALGIYWRFLKKPPSARAESPISAGPVPAALPSLPPQVSLLADPARLRLGVNLQFR
jgi:hypothetical protein